MGQTDQLPMQRSGSIPWLPSIDSLLSEQEAALCCDLLSCDNLYRPKSFSDLGALYQGDHHGLGNEFPLVPEHPVPQQPPAAQVPNGNQGGQPAWRCIETSHPADCKMCTEPPSVEEEGKFVLIGDVARKNGEKKLRGLLSCTPEWRSTESRLRLSEKVKTAYPNMMALSVALQQRDLTALRKAHLLCMCREWRFRSSIWQPRNRRTVSGNGTASTNGGSATNPSRHTSNGNGLKRPRSSLHDMNGSPHNNMGVDMSGNKMMRAPPVPMYVPGTPPMGNPLTDPVSARTRSNHTAVENVQDSQVIAFEASGAAANTKRPNNNLTQEEQELLEECNYTLFQEVVPQTKCALLDIYNDPASRQYITETIQARENQDTPVAFCDDLTRALRNPSTVTASKLADMHVITDIDSLRVVTQQLRMHVTQAIADERAQLLFSDSSKDNDMKAYEVVGSPSSVEQLLILNLEISKYLLSHGLSYLPREAQSRRSMAVAVNIKCLEQIRSLVHRASYMRFHIFRQATTASLAVLGVINSSYELLFRKGKLAYGSAS